VAEPAAAITGIAAADLRLRDAWASLKGDDPTLGATLDHVDRQPNTPDSALAFPLVLVRSPDSVGSGRITPMTRRCAEDRWR
jgi:hypothetical protein